MKALEKLPMQQISTVLVRQSNLGEQFECEIAQNCRRKVTKRLALQLVQTVLHDDHEGKKAELETAAFEAEKNAQHETFLKALTKDKRYYLRNKAQRGADSALRRAGPAAPTWLTQDQKSAILAVYKEAQQWADQTGVTHEVDHVIPLVGVCPHTRVQNVCGLHVPWNLRTIPRSLNKRRGNNYFIGKPPFEVDDEIPF
jgi:hypothetical protein